MGSTASFHELICPSWAKPPVPPDHFVLEHHVCTASKKQDDGLQHLLTYCDMMHDPKLMSSKRQYKVCKVSDTLLPQGFRVCWWDSHLFPVLMRRLPGEGKALLQRQHCLPLVVR